jgi:hypothetical protein
MAGTPCVQRLLRRHELGAIAEGGAAEVASLGRHPKGRLEVRFAGLKDAIWVCLKIGYIPNEIAIENRDNDQQNHWENGVHYFQTHPFGWEKNGKNHG